MLQYRNLFIPNCHGIKFISRIVSIIVEYFSTQNS